MGSTHYYDKLEYCLFATALQEDSSWLQAGALQVAQWRELRKSMRHLLCKLASRGSISQEQKAPNIRKLFQSMYFSSTHSSKALGVFCPVHIPVSLPGDSCHLLWAFLLSGIFASQCEYWEIHIAHLANIKLWVLYCIAIHGVKQ